MKRISLAQIKTNRKAKIAEIAGGANLQNRLMNMGMHKGREIVKLSHIGLKGPVVVKAGRSILALGHGVAAKIMLEAE